MESDERKSRIGYLIKTLHLQTECTMAKTVKEMGLTPSQTMVIGYMRHHTDRDISPIDLSRHFDISHPTVVGILKRLEDKGYVTMERSKSDSRRKTVVLTDKTDDLDRKIRETLDHTEEVLRRGISAADQEIFKNTALKMIENMKKERITND